MPNDNHKTLWEESLAELDTYHAILEPYFGKSVPRAVIEDALKHFEEYKRLKALSSVYGRFARKQKMTTIPTTRFLEIDRQSCLYAYAVEQIAKAISEGNEKGYNTRNKDSDRRM